MNDRKRFENIRACWCKSREAERAYRLHVLHDRYRKTDPPSHWLTATERRRLESLRRTQDHASDAMFTLLDRIGGRSWKSLIPHHWVMEELTFEDAITRGRLSVVPPCGYGASAREVERFANARAEQPVGRSGQGRFHADDRRMADRVNVGLLQQLPNTQEGQTMHTEDLTALSIVKLGYALDDPTDQHRCLNFRVGFTDHEAAFSALVAIGDYNEFNGTTVARAIQSVGLDRYTRVTVGREGSPVVYVGPFYGDRDASTLNALTAALQAASADECDFDGRLLRAWWD